MPNQIYAPCFGRGEEIKDGVVFKDYKELKHAYNSCNSPCVEDYSGWDPAATAFLIFGGSSTDGYSSGTASGAGRLNKTGFGGGSACGNDGMSGTTSLILGLDHAGKPWKHS